MDSEDIDTWRRSFPVTEQRVYLNHAAMGPLSGAARDAHRAALDAYSREGSIAGTRLRAEAETARSDFASLIGARPDEIAVTSTTAAAIGAVAHALPWHAGDNVVLADIEFPSNVFPWLSLASRQVAVRFVAARAGRVPVEALAAACDPATRVIAISLVQFSNGYRADIASLGEFCRSRGIVLVVDAMQAVGAVAIDVGATPIDVLVSGSHKWLCGPVGAGWLYVRRDIIDRFTPTMVGPLSMTERKSHLDYSYELRGDARRFEHGTLNTPAMIGAGAAVRLMRDAGLARIEARLLDLTDYLDEGLRRRGCTVLSPGGARRERSGIVAFAHPSIDGAVCADRLAEAGIVVSVRAGAVRVSPHFYNTHVELDALIEALP